MFSTPPGTKAVRMSIAGPDACRACVLLRMIRPWCNSLLSMRFNSGEVPCCHPVAPDTLDPGHLLGNQVEPGQLPAPPVGKRPGGCQQALPLNVSLIWCTAPPVTVSV
jgi:hypothetical protein